MVEPPIDASLGGCKSPPNKEVSLPKSEILSPAGSIVMDSLHISEVYSSSAASLVSPGLMEGYSGGFILKPGRGAVFVHVFSFLSICRDLVVMVTVSSYLPCDCA